MAIVPLRVTSAADEKQKASFMTVTDNMVHF